MGKSFGAFLKYPRTPHIFGSKGTDDDKKLGMASSLEIIGHSGLVVEEKIDGSNSAVQFDAPGNVILQNRGQYWFEKESEHPWEKGLTHPQYNLFKRWALAQKHVLYPVLGSRYIMYGEWMFAKHHIFYNELPHYFMEFDIYDRQGELFLDTAARQRLLSETGIVSAGILRRGPLKNLDHLQSLIVKSLYADVMAEGLYVKVEEEGKVTSRAKFVRQDFTQEIIDLGRHWADVKMVQNKLKPGTCNDELFKS